jgi:tripartite ATP-independent transporter DctM subunit
MEMNAVAPVVILIGLIALGLPISFCLGGAGLIGIWLMTGSWNGVMNILGTTPFTSVADYVLTTIPMFIFMAHLSAYGGLAQKLYDATSNWLSHIRGGLAIASVFAVMIFGAMSGASTAAASVMSKICIPNMRRFGYSDTLSAGVVGVGATTDILIPPSVGMVIYSVMTGTSLGKLLIAGIVPGVIVCLFLILCIFVWVTVRPSDAPQAAGVPWAKRWRSLLTVLPTVLLIIMVLVFLYAGIATPTEVGAIGAFFAAVIGIFLGRLTWAGIVDAMKETINTSAMIFLIFIGANIFGNFIMLSRFPQLLMTIVAELNLGPWAVLSGVLIAYFVISMFMDEVPLLIITLQLTFQIITRLGFDPIWFGVICMLMVSMGLVFPPVGIDAFIVSASANIDLTKVYKGTTIMMTAIVLTLVLVMVFPSVVLWLPSHMH